MINIPKEILGLSIHSQGAYVKLFGYGLLLIKDSPTLFSERYGYRKVFRIGRWALKILRPI